MAKREYIQANKDWLEAKAKEEGIKAIEEIGERERHQLFSYLIGTQFPIGILVNFASYPKAEIEKYYYDRKDGTITPF